MARRMTCQRSNSSTTMAQRPQLDPNQDPPTAPLYKRDVAFPPTRRIRLLAFLQKAGAEAVDAKGFGILMSRLTRR
jgi:hypothetical protein